LAALATPTPDGAVVFTEHVPDTAASHQYPIKADEHVKVSVAGVPVAYTHVPKAQPVTPVIDNVAK